MSFFNKSNLFPGGSPSSSTEKNQMATLSLPAAIEKADLSGVKTLLDLGADPNNEDIAGICIMSKAIMLPDSENKRQIIIQLLMAGGNISKKVISDANFWKGGKRVKKFLPGATRKILLK